MSNGAVGPVYATIIDRIIEAARNDFEEGGYDQRTLEELKEQWQKNLSDFSIAQLPWDPPPPQPQIANPPTLPSNVGKIENGGLAIPSNQANYVKSEVKQEPGHANGFNPNSLAASQRAASLLQQQFGSQANASITAAGLQQHQQARPGLSLPGQVAQPGHQQQASQRPAHIQLPGMPEFPANDIGATQLDGSADAESAWTRVRDSQRASGTVERLHADATLRAQLDATINITDSGLFSSSIPARSRGASKLSRARSDGVPQLDGVDDDDDPKAEDDADAINSDLDDDDEAQENVDDEGEGPVGETILCTYDKVQRVKNKWKCVLKDGILTTGNKEYVFHKANGEFEW